MHIELAYDKGKFIYYKKKIKRNKYKVIRNKPTYLY